MGSAWNAHTKPRVARTDQRVATLYFWGVMTNPMSFDEFNEWNFDAFCCAPRWGYDEQFNEIQRVSVICSTMFFCEFDEAFSLLGAMSDQ